MSLPAEFVFSQTSLQDYADCARRFELRYLQRVRWPALQAEPALEHERHLRQGERFHHLVHQHQLGIPAEALGASIDDPVLRAWWEAYLAWPLADVPARRWPETALSAPLGEYRLMAKFDLLAVEPGGRAVIIDWKTSPHPPPRDWLAKRLQTRVYPLVLALAGADLTDGQPILPEQIEMVYWYPVGSAVRFAYTAAQFEHDQAALLQMVEDIAQRAEFSLTPERKTCAFCTYRSLCDRGERAASVDALLDVEEDSADGLQIDLDQIAEIEF